jgi:asparagine synthase (glutamine-hydrolysing)
MRLRSDQRVCVALSGGVDSGVVAESLLRRRGRLDGFSLLIAGASPALRAPIAAIERALPTLHLHPIEVSYVAPNMFDSLPVSDDAVFCGPATQQARLTLLRTACDAGFEQVFDGEGSDELFDIAWRHADLLRQAAWKPALELLARRAERRRLISDLLASGNFGISSRLWLERQRRACQQRRPWLARSFWEGKAFDVAWQDTVSSWSASCVRQRLADIVSAHARHWRTQSQLRTVAGVEGQSPFLDRRVIELAGSLPARIAMEVGHRKPLIRRLARDRLPSLDVWRPKREPLDDWLVNQIASDDAYLRVAIDRIKENDLLNDWIDTMALATASRWCREMPGSKHASSIVQLFGFVEWTHAVRQRCLGLRLDPS